MAFNYREFKRQFKEAAQRHGIDPERGASEFQAVLIRATINAELHDSRMRQLVRAAAERQAEQFKRGVRWEEGGGLLHPDGSIDEMRVAEAEKVNWWELMNPDDWKPGADSSRTERQALTPIKRNVKARRFKEAAELVHELLEENPTQAEMKANLSQKERI